VKERVRNPVRTTLLDPKYLLLFVCFFIVLVCIKHAVFRGHGGMSVQNQTPGAVIAQGDARSFLYFEPADINRIDLEGLVLIPGIGLTSAQKIMDFRDRFGFILDIEELYQPAGPFGYKKMAILRQYLKAGDGR